MTKINLSDLSNAAFNDIVNADVRDSLDTETSASLRSAVPQRWHDTLLSIKRNAESQLAGDRADRAEQQTILFAKGDKGRMEWQKYLAQRERWRAKTIRFKNGVEDKLNEAKRLLAKNPDSSNSYLVRERNAAMKTAMQMREGIMRHKQEMSAMDLDPDTHDQQLWKLLD